MTRLNVENLLDVSITGKINYSIEELSHGYFITRLSPYPQLEYFFSFDDSNNVDYQIDPYLLSFLGYE